MSAPERFTVTVLLTAALLAIPIGLWRHGIFTPVGWANPAARVEVPGAAEGACEGTGGAGQRGETSAASGHRDGDALGGIAAATGGVNAGSDGGGMAVGSDAGGVDAGPYEGLPLQEGGGELVVHVAGAVRRPGVYVLPAGARVVDAIRAAGGEEGDGAAWVLNLAARLLDGDRIYVPERQEVAGQGAAGGGWGGPSPGSAGTAATGAGAPVRVDVNHASAEELDAVPGIGPTLAQRIVAYRRANGPFARVEDLTKVPGIGPKTLEAMKEWLVAR